VQRHQAEISNRESGAISGRKSGGHARACGSLTCRVLMPCLRSSIRMLGVALCLLSVMPSPSRAKGTVALAYVVSPPPATREVMPRYLPQLPRETTTRIRQVASPSARRLRAGCWCGHRRLRHPQRCARCRHRVRNLGASRRCRHAHHCSTHRRGHSERHRWRPPQLRRKAVNGINGQIGDRIAIAAAFGVVVPSARTEPAIWDVTPRCEARLLVASLQPRLNESTSCRH